MGLQYDFDIHWIMPQELTADPKIAKLMGDIGFNFDARSNYVALFRNQATVDALGGADPDVRAYFEASGFGWNTYDSGAGSGRFPAHEEARIADVTERLSDNLAKFDLAGKNWNGFEMSGFLEHIVTLEPVEMPKLPSAEELAKTLQPEPASGGTPLDRVRRKHDAAAQAARSADMEDGIFSGHNDMSLPDPEMGPVNKERVAKAARADRAFRVKSGLGLIFGAAILFTVAISQGQSLKDDGVLVAAPVSQQGQSLDVPGNKALTLTDQTSDTSEIDQSDL